MKLGVLLLFGAGALVISQATTGRMRWFGVSESVAEFGENTLPGVLGKEYYWPDPNAIDLLIADGMNMFRIPFRMERLSPDTVDGQFAPKYLEDLISTVKHITKQGAWAVIDPHNYGRYYENLLVPEQFKVFWAKLATYFADDQYVVFDTNNEYHDMSDDLVLKLNQAAIDGVRSVGATSQYIFVEGNAWSGAWSWVQNNDFMKALTDPQNKIIFQMHSYFNADASSSSTCLSPTIGQERAIAATEWLRTNNKLGVIGEFSGYDDDTCKQAVAGMIKYLSENSDVWTGALWWAAGPWWGTSEYSFEPPTGHAYTVYKSILQPYYPSSTTSIPTSTTTSIATWVTTTSASTTKTTASTTKTTASTTKTTASTKTSATRATTTTTRTTTTSTTTTFVQHWWQCGGIGFNGPTHCASPYTCQKQNDWFFQCL